MDLEGGLRWSCYSGSEIAQNDKKETKKEFAGRNSTQTSGVIPFFLILHRQRAFWLSIVLSESLSAKQNAAFSLTKASLLSNYSQKEKLPRRKLRTRNCKEKMVIESLIILFLRLKTVKIKWSALKILSAFVFEQLCWSCVLKQRSVIWQWVAFISDMYFSSTSWKSGCVLDLLKSSRWWQFEQ